MARCPEQEYSFFDTWQREKDGGTETVFQAKRDGQNKVISRSCVAVCGLLENGAKNIEARGWLERILDLTLSSRPALLHLREYSRSLQQGSWIHDEKGGFCPMGWSCLAHRGPPW